MAALVRGAPFVRRGLLVHREARRHALLRREGLSLGEGRHIRAAEPCWEGGLAGGRRHAAQVSLVEVSHAGVGLAPWVAGVVPPHLRVVVGEAGRASQARRRRGVR